MSLHVAVRAKKENNAMQRGRTLLLLLCESDDVSRDCLWLCVLVLVCDLVLYHYCFFIKRYGCLVLSIWPIYFFPMTVESREGG